MKKHYRCRVLIDSEVVKKHKIYEPSQTAFFIMAHLYDPDGWKKHGYTFENVPEKEDILIRLSLPETIETLDTTSQLYSRAIQKFKIVIKAFLPIIDNMTTKSVQNEGL